MSTVTLSKPKIFTALPGPNATRVLQATRNTFHRLTLVPIRRGETRPRYGRH